MSNPFRDIYLEALTGNQHKIDADKDGKIEGEDLAKLRAKKMKKEAAEVPFSGPYSKGPTVVTDKSGAKHSPFSRAKHLAKMAAQKQKEKANSQKFGKDVKEEIEIEEGMKPYVSSTSPKMGEKGSHDVVGKDGKVIKSYEYNKEGMQAAQMHLKKIKEEAEELEEISKKTLGSYVNKASVDMANRTAEGERKRTMAGADYAHNISRGMDVKTAEAGMKKDREAAKPDVKKSVQRMRGIEKAVGRLTKEEVEELDELSKSTLASYTKKATKDARMQQSIGKDFEASANKSRKPSMKDAAQSLADKYKSKSRSREAGIGKAVDRLAKEEVEELDEGILSKVAGKIANATGVTPQAVANSTLSAINKKAPGTKMHGHPNFSKFKSEVHAHISSAKNAEEAIRRSSDDHVKSLAKKHFTEEVEQVDEKSDQAKRNKTMKNLMAASKGAQINRGLKLEPAEYGYKKAQHLNKAIGRAAMRAEETEMKFTQEELQLIEQFIEIAEKMNLSKATMGDVIKDFKKSDAPQFKGKSDEKRRQMAIAAKLSADRETKKEEVELVSFKGFNLDEIKMSDLPSRKVSGKYGTEYYKKEKEKDEKGYDADDEKEPSEKRGRGRPKGSASGARQKGSTPKKKGSGVEMTGYPLHLPNR